MIQIHGKKPLIIIKINLKNPVKSQNHNIWKQINKDYKLLKITMKQKMKMKSMMMMKNNKINKNNSRKSKKKLHLLSNRLKIYILYLKYKKNKKKQNLYRKKNKRKKNQKILRRFYKSQEWMPHKIKILKNKHLRKINKMEVKKTKKPRKRRRRKIKKKNNNKLQKQKKKWRN